MPDILYKIEEDVPAGFRLDLFISEKLKLISRSQIKAKKLTAKINGKDVKISKLVKKGDVLELSWEDEPPLHIIPQDIPLEIIYEDENCIVINKAQGMVVHPGAGNRQNTLANAVYFRIKTFQPAHEWAEGLRPGIVHRLDKETSGVIIAAYNEKAHAFLSRQFKARQTKKNYLAIVCGTPKEKKGRIETFIARDPKDRKRFAVSDKGKLALTFYKVLKSGKNYSLILLRPKTGRTHQLRVHLKYLGCPILGDSAYGSKDKKFPNATLMLHSKSLAITLFGESDARIFSSLLPERFREIIGKF